MSRELKIIDLFCGAGGLSSGFQLAGFKTILGVDNNARAIETFLANHTHSKAICNDMRNVTAQEIINKMEKQSVDVIVGGPPCQGFSMAGNRDPNDPRNSMFKEYVKVVDAIRPKIFVMENVRGLLSMKNKRGENIIDIIMNEFNKLKDYDVKYYPVNSADYGVPQRRRRVFIIGVKRGYSFKFPDKTHSKESEEGLKRWVGVGEVILKRKDIPEKYFYSEKLIKGFLRRERENKKKGVGFGWQFNKLDQPSYTLSARYWKDGAESLIKYDESTIRMLTPVECALIQSFPKNYVFKGNEREVYTQVGNAVPPLMAAAIAKSIKSALNV